MIHLSIVIQLGHPSLLEVQKVGLRGKREHTASQLLSFSETESSRPWKKETSGRKTTAWPFASCRQIQCHGHILQQGTQACSQIEENTLFLHCKLKPVELVEVNVDFCTLYPNSL